jgi:hypothetical protein
MQARQLKPAVASGNATLVSSRLLPPSAARMPDLAQKWSLGLDGSKLSWLAFDFVTNLIDRRACGDSVRPARSTTTKNPQGQ